MTAPRTSDQANNPTPASAGVLFTRTHDGLLVAKVRDNAFAMMPTGNDRYYLASAWRLSRPMEEWSRADFYGHGGELADEAAFRARVHENAEHQRQRAALGGAGKSAPARIHPGAPRNARPSMQTASSPTRPPDTAAFISMPHIMQRSTLPFARMAAGTKRTALGRLSRKHFRNCSRSTNGVAPIKPSATGIPTRGRRFMAASFCRENLTRRIARRSSAITPPTGS